MNPRVHYLLEIDAHALLDANTAAPEWVAESLAVAPFVVVRRGFPTRHLLPVGVRGTQRNQRWAGMCDLGWIRSALSPFELMSRIPSAATALEATLASLPPSARDQAIPALRSMAALANSEPWRALRQPWGPGGSVGFELATGHDTATPESDLDLVIYADERLSAEQATSLHEATRHLPSAVDVRIETPVCGFSLAEYATKAPAPILLRTPSGVLLGVDPWDGAPARAPVTASASSP